MSPYREPTPRELRPLPVLREEVDEAHKHAEGWIIGASFTAAVGTFPTAIGIYHRALAAIPFVLVLWGATVLCLAGYWRGRRTIRRWRDQERRRIAEGEK